MSKVTNVYNGVLTALATLYPNKTRIPNVMKSSLEYNPEQFLRNGYGLKVESESPEGGEFHTFTRNRIFSIVLTKEVLTTNMQTSQMDTAILSLLEETYSLQKDFMNADQIGIDNYLDIINMVGSSEVYHFVGERNSFIAIDVMFNIRITDDI